MPCTLSPASTCPPLYIRDDEPDPSDEKIWAALYRHADGLKSLAASHGLEVIILQPMSQYEGWVEGSHRSHWVREKAKRWLPLCSKLGVTYLQVRTPCRPPGQFLY
jgi:sugar phosphate isomerase/epimerase